MLDFTLGAYRKLLEIMKAEKYRFLSVGEYLTNPNAFQRFVVIRHDVERKEGNAERMARLESKLQAPSTYYFRSHLTFDRKIIKRVHGLGREVGYHYEALAKMGGDYNRAIDLFKKELKELQGLVPVGTISAHGSPLSGYDNRKLWDRFDLGDFGIIGDAAASVDFSEILYLTDTGRGWNRDMGNVRDKVAGGLDLKFSGTRDLIEAIDNGILKDKIMLNVHPHRWNDNLFTWTAELISQNIKNLAKGLLVDK